MIEPPFAGERYLEAYRAALADYWDREDVSAVDIGYGTGERVPRTELCVRVHLNSASPRSWTEFVAALPREIRGVPVEPVAAAYRLHGCRPPGSIFPEQESRTEQLGVLRPGVSVCGRNMPGGTLGMIVFDADTDAPCMLSNRHILDGTPGRNGKVDVLQPSLRYCGGQCEAAELTRVLNPADGDAAIAMLTGARQYSLEQFETHVVIRDTRMPRLDDLLVKSGVGTGVTWGRVEAGGRYKLLFTDSDLVAFGMDGFRILPAEDGCRLSGEMDSGSVWYGLDDHAGVGLHVGGESPGTPKEYAVAAYLPVVLKGLRVSPLPRASMLARAGRDGDAEAPAGTQETVELLAESVARLTRILERVIGNEGGDE